MPRQSGTVAGAGHILYRPRRATAFVAIGSEGHRRDAGQGRDRFIDRIEGESPLAPAEGGRPHGVPTARRHRCSSTALLKRGEN